jgi:hypothetical protein
MIGLKIALVGFALWFVFGLLTNSMDQHQDRVWWYSFGTVALFGVLLVPLGLIVWIFE